MKSIKSKEELTTILLSEGIKLDDWGKGTFKSLDNLWEEIEGGETSLQINPFSRITEVVQVIILNDQKILIEDEQLFKDGRKRKRNKPPSEKMKPGENCRNAAIRCVIEELEVEKNDISIISSSDNKKVEVKDSPSYPGLKTKYIFHIVEARVVGLPDNAFWTSEISHNETDSVSKHHWIWSEDFEDIFNAYRPTIHRPSRTGDVLLG